MTWARNVFVVGLVFMMGRASVRVGWYDFAIQQVALVLLAAAIIAVWWGIETLERRAKDKRRKARSAA